MREALGFDARELTPVVIRKITILGAETRSFKRAVIALKEADVRVSDKTVERVIHDVGEELALRRDLHPKQDRALAQYPENVPDLAVVECDGGRIRCRQPDQGPGVHLEGKGWRETKNACLIRGQRKTFDVDPQLNPPDCFLNPKHVAKIAETEALSVASLCPQDHDSDANNDNETAHIDPLNKGYPKRLVRTVLSSMACSKEFGKQMKREAKRRRFFEANAKAFLGDGLPWNWSIWKKHFWDFVPILDFIHVLSYLFITAKTVHDNPQDAWDQYQVWMVGCWRGEVDQVLTELANWQARLGEPPDDADDNDPRKIIATALRYLTNNQSRMDYARYRQIGLPITTAWMESLVKEMNYRVKGTEMFWNDPAGAEAILQIRAAALSDDERLATHLKTRSGSPFVRKRNHAKPPKENTIS